METTIEIKAIDNKPNINEAYRLGYLSPNYYRDRDLIQKYLDYMQTGLTEKQARSKLIEGTDYSPQYIYIILKRWGL